MWLSSRCSSLENKNENQNLIFKNRQHGILQHLKSILTAKAHSTSLVVFRKFKRLISLVQDFPNWGSRPREGSRNKLVGSQG